MSIFSDIIASDFSRSFQDAKRMFGHGLKNDSYKTIFEKSF